MVLTSALSKTIEASLKEFHRIPNERKTLLRELAQFVKTRRESGLEVDLVFICTHNSRRSHIAQLWAQAAASYYGVSNVDSYSGGTEATAFNPRAVKAMKGVGFEIEKETDGENPVYQVLIGPNIPAIKIFSKRYDDPVNPSNGFAAVMTCTHADENCPVVEGAEFRISIPYDDPKDFDGTPLEVSKYEERVKEIGRELLYAFSIILP